MTTAGPIQGGAMKTESHCMARIAGGHEPHEHESLIGRRLYWCPGGEPPVVTCKSTMLGKGCGHPTTDHIGERTAQTDCPCCSWRLSEPSSSPREAS